MAAGLWGCAALPESLSPGPLGSRMELGSVEGQLRFSKAGAELSELGPVVVYLDSRPALQGGPASSGVRTVFDGAASPEGPDEAGLGSELVVLARGESLRFESRRGLEHRLFALRGRERIDVRVPAQGPSPEVRMQRSGWTRFYCSLHQDEVWDSFVAPSVHYAQVEPGGAYRIAGVPPGDYRLRIWSHAVDGTVRTVRVERRRPTVETIWLDPDKVDR